MTETGTGALTGVPPAFKVITAPPTVMDVVAVGIGMTTVVPRATNVSDRAADVGYGFGSNGRIISC